MNQPLLIVIVALARLRGAQHHLVGAACRWRGGWAEFDLRSSRRPHARARLVWLRAMPAAAALTVTLVIVVPAFAIFEPEHASEEVGPALAMLALIGATQLGIALILAAVSLVRTASVTRAWLRSGTPLDVNPPAGVPAYAIDSPAPIVALVGVFAPKLIAARAVIDVCTHRRACSDRGARARPSACARQSETLADGLAPQTRCAGRASIARSRRPGTMPPRMRLTTWRRAAMWAREPTWRRCS